MASDAGERVALMLEALALDEASLDCSFTWAGGDIPCTAGGEYDSQILDEGGMRSVTKLQIKVRTSELPDGAGDPKKGHTILYKRNSSADPKQYRIDGVTNYYGAWLELNCVSPNRAA